MSEIPDPHLPVPEQSDRAREYRARRAAARVGLHLSKDRRTGMWYVARVDTVGEHWRSRELISDERGIYLDEAEEIIAEAAEEEAAATEAARQQHRQQRRGASR